MSAAPHSCLLPSERSHHLPAAQPLCPKLTWRCGGGVWEGGRRRQRPHPQPRTQQPVVFCSGDHIFSPKNQAMWCDREMHRREKTDRGRKITPHFVVYLMRATNKPLSSGFVLV